MTRYRAIIHRDNLIDATVFHLVRKSEGEASDVALAIQDLAFVKTGENIPRACHVDDTHDIVQAIVDAAWEAGIRPHSYKDEASSIARIEFHLADMRALVFKVTPTKGQPK